MKASTIPTRRFDPSLSGMYDAVHGSVDLSDACKGTRVCSLVSLIGRPMLERMRRIKLLGYASHSYPSADHSRYAHALGSMHVMRLILHQVATTLRDNSTLFKELKVFGRPEIKGFDVLVQHMLVATLLQDVGEFPYGQATSRVLRPADSVRGLVSDKTGIDTSGWNPKDVFTVASVFEDEYCSQSRLNHRFITFLASGHIKGHEAAAHPPSLRMLRHMIEGEVDADRLDYVYRDAHHTVGGRGSPLAVVDSLVAYDEKGPIFAEPGPVAEFLATRSSLWTSVYFSAEKRFRTLLLITLLRECRELPDLARGLFGEASTGDLSYRAFHELDDISLHERLRTLSTREFVNRLSRKAVVALHVLLGRGPEYECVWLPAREMVTDEGGEIRLPADLFFDSFADYEENHIVYEPSSIRVVAHRFRLLQDGSRTCYGQ